MPTTARSRGVPSIPAPRAGKHSNQPLSSPSGKAVASSVASRASGSEEDNDEDDDEEDDEDEEDEDIGEDEEDLEKTGFDENFLAQLMAMDPLFANGSLNVPNSKDNSKSLPDVCSQAAGFAAADAAAVTHENNVDASSTGVMQQSTPFPNMPAYASTASTPSNEFYDGAINFLTEVLGSTDPTLWNPNAAPDNDPASAQDWNREGGTSVNSAPSPAPTQAQFKSLQPLIGNLIARLKGQPVEETGQPPRVQEEDLVVLLQTLMAQRQAQSERKTTQQSQGGRSRTQRQPQSQSSQQLVSTSAPSGSSNRSQPTGFSIVDFDFGEDDDDPDFDPGRINLDFGNSDEFARALAEVTKDTGTGSVQPALPGSVQANDKAWQQMLDTFGVPNNATQASPGGGRRTRSTSKHGDKVNTLSSTVSLSAGAMKSNDDSVDMNSVEEDDEVDSMLKDSEAGGDDSLNGKARKRKAYSAEEALERRREANRECARRQRAKKKQETEQARAELERIRNMHGGAEVPSEAILEVTRSLISKRKRGRPLGSRNRRTIEEMERYAAQTAEDATLADLRAENRVMCAEMHRLREENAQLRARVIRHEEFFESLGKHDLVKRLTPTDPSLIPSYGNGHDRRRDSSDEGYEEDESDEDADVTIDGRSNDRRHVNRGGLDPASQFLAYHPFREAFKGNGGPASAAAAMHSSRSASRQVRSRQRIDDTRSDKMMETHPAMNVELWQRMSESLDQGQRAANRDTRSSGDHIRHSRTYDSGARSAIKGNSERALQELLRAAANEMA